MREPSAEALSLIDDLFKYIFKFQEPLETNKLRRGEALKIDAFAVQAVAAERAQPKALSEEDRELLAKATPRPWRAVYQEGVRPQLYHGAVSGAGIGGIYSNADAALIVAAVNAYEDRPQARGLSEADAKRLEILRKTAIPNGHIQFLIDLLDTSDQRVAQDTCP